MCLNVATALFVSSLTYISASDIMSHMFVTFHAIIFWKSNVLTQDVLAKNGFWHEIATQGHSRSFTLQSVTGQQLTRGSISPYNIAGLISKVSEEVAT